MTSEGPTAYSTGKFSKHQIHDNDPFNAPQHLGLHTWRLRYTTVFWTTLLKNQSIHSSTTTTPMRGNISDAFVRMERSRIPVPNSSGASMGRLNWLATSPICTTGQILSALSSNGCSCGASTRSM